MELIVKDPVQIQVIKNTISKISSSKLPGDIVNLTITKDNYGFSLNFTLDTFINLYDGELNDDDITKGIFYSIGYYLVAKEEDKFPTYDKLESRLLNMEAMGGKHDGFKNMYFPINKDELDSFNEDWDSNTKVNNFTMTTLKEDKTKKITVVFWIDSENKIPTNFDYDINTFTKYECKLNPFTYPVNEMLLSPFFQKEDLNYSVKQIIMLSYPQLVHIKSLISKLGDFNLELELNTDNENHQLIIFKSRNKNNKGFDTIFKLNDMITMKGKFSIPKDQLKLLQIYFSQMDNSLKINDKDGKLKEKNESYILNPTYSDLKVIAINCFNETSFWLHFQINYIKLLVVNKEYVEMGYVLKQEFMVNMNLINDA